MRLITILTIANNYPEQILIEAGQDSETGKWMALIYLLKGKDIHTLLIDTAPVFETEEAAKEKMVELCDWCLKYVSENEVFGDDD